MSVFDFILEGDLKFDGIIWWMLGGNVIWSGVLACLKEYSMSFEFMELIQFFFNFGDGQDNFDYKLVKYTYVTA